MSVRYDACRGRKHRVTQRSRQVYRQLNRPPRRRFDALLVKLAWVQPPFDQLVVDHLLPRLLPESRLNDRHTAGVMRDMASELGVEVFKRQQEAIIGRPDSRPDLHAIHCPTLIICGREDRTTPPEVHQEMADAIPGAQLEVIDSCAHLAPLEQPESVTRALRSWLLETRSTYALR